MERRNDTYDKMMELKSKLTEMKREVEALKDAMSVSKDEEREISLTENAILSNMKGDIQYCFNYRR